MKAEPILILCSPRSGSTLLRVMLAGHRQLFSPPELHLLGYNSMKERDIDLGPCPWGSCHGGNDCDQRQGLQRAFMELASIDDAASRQLIQKWIDRDEPIQQVYEMLDSLAAPRRIVDKSPSYSSHVETMQKAQKLFPRASYIYLHRHPYAVMSSIIRNHSQTVSKAQAIWTARNKNINAFLESVPQRQQIRIGYEDLVQNPEPVMRKLCEFLDLEFDPSTLEPYEGRRMTDGIRPGVRPPGDWNFYYHHDIDPTMADKWRDREFPELGEDAQYLCSVLGYELPAPVSGIQHQVIS